MTNKEIIVNISIVLINKVVLDITIRKIIRNSDVIYYI